MIRGADVEGLRNIASSCLKGIEAATALQQVVTQMLNAAWASGPWSASFVAFLMKLLRWLLQVIQQLQNFVPMLLGNAEEQKQASGETTAAGVPSTAQPAANRAADQTAAAQKASGGGGGSAKQSTAGQDQADPMKKLKELADTANSLSTLADKLTGQDATTTAAAAPTTTLPEQSQVGSLMPQEPASQPSTVVDPVPSVSQPIRSVAALDDSLAVPVGGPLQSEIGSGGDGGAPLGRSADAGLGGSSPGGSGSLDPKLAAGPAAPPAANPEVLSRSSLARPQGAVLAASVDPTAGAEPAVSHVAGQAAGGRAIGTTAAVLGAGSLGAGASAWLQESRAARAARADQPDTFEAALDGSLEGGRTSDRLGTPA